MATVLPQLSKLQFLENLQSEIGDYHFSSNCNLLSCSNPVAAYASKLAASSPQHNPSALPSAAVCSQKGGEQKVSTQHLRPSTVCRHQTSKQPALIRPNLGETNRDFCVTSVTIYYKALKEAGLDTAKKLKHWMIPASLQRPLTGRERGLETQTQ